MRIRGLIQSTSVEEISATAEDAQSARELIEAQVPEGFELIQVHNSMPRGGSVVATGKIRSAATQQLEATGPDYKSARDALLASIPEGHRLLHVLTVD